MAELIDLSQKNILKFLFTYCVQLHINIISFFDNFDLHLTDKINKQKNVAFVDQMPIRK